MSLVSLIPCRPITAKKSRQIPKSGRRLHGFLRRGAEQVTRQEFLYLRHFHLFGLHPNPSLTKPVIPIFLIHCTAKGGRQKGIGKKVTKNEKVSEKWPKTRKSLPKSDRKRMRVAYPFFPPPFCGTLTHMQSREYAEHADQAQHPAQHRKSRKVFPERDGEQKSHRRKHPTKYQKNRWTAGCPWQNGLFFVSFSIAKNKDLPGHRPVDPCLSRRVSEGTPGQCPENFLKFTCLFLSFNRLSAMFESLFRLCLVWNLQSRFGSQLLQNHCWETTNGGAKRIVRFWGGENALHECPLQNQFWRPQKVGFVWSVPAFSKEHDTAWTNGGGNVS